MGQQDVANHKCVYSEHLLLIEETGKADLRRSVCVCINSPPVGILRSHPREALFTRVLKVANKGNTDIVFGTQTDLVAYLEGISKQRAAKCKRVTADMFPDEERDNTHT